MVHVLAARLRGETASTFDREERKVDIVSLLGRQKAGVHACIGTGYEATGVWTGEDREKEREEKRVW